MRLFSIQAVASIHVNGGESASWGYTRHEQLPTFYVDGDVQGFFTEAGAAEIARRVIDPFGQYAPGDLVITAVEL